VIAFYIIVGYIVMGGVVGAMFTGFDADDPDWDLIVVFGIFWPIWVPVGLFAGAAWSVSHLVRRIAGKKEP
jgi:hypothetical protein